MPESCCASRPCPSGPVGRVQNISRDRYIQVLTVLGFALPVAIYVWYLHHYGLNVVSGDQWNDVSIIGASYKGKLTLGALWAQFNENRLFFPYLIVLGLSRTVAFNLRIEQYLGAGCLCGAIALIVSAHKRRSPKTPWLAYSRLRFSCSRWSRPTTHCLDSNSPGG